MEILDNVNKTVKDDLEKTVSKGDKISIAAACFSIYAYETLKEKHPEKSDYYDQKIVEIQASKQK